MADLGNLEKRHRERLPRADGAEGRDSPVTGIHALSGGGGVGSGADGGARSVCGASGTGAIGAAGSLISGPGVASRLQPSAAMTTSAHARHRIMGQGYRKPSTAAVASSRVRATMAAIPLPIHWPGVAAALLFAAALPACRPRTSCSAELTDVAGVFRGTVSGKRARSDLEGEALSAACTQLCAASGPSPAPDSQDGGTAYVLPAQGCVSSCAADAQAGKISMRASCTDGSSP